MAKFERNFSMGIQEENFSQLRITNHC